MHTPSNTSELTRTPSEVALSELHLSFTSGNTNVNSTDRNSFEADNKFADSAMAALNHLSHLALSTPPHSQCLDPSSGSGAVHGGTSPRPIFSPVQGHSPVPDYEGPSNPFFSTRALYHSDWIHHPDSSEGFPVPTAGESPSSSVGASSCAASSLFDEDAPSSYFASTPSSFTSGLLSRSNSVKSDKRSGSVSGHVEDQDEDDSLAARRGRPMRLSLPARTEITQADFDAVQALAKAAGPKCQAFKFGSPPKAQLAADAFASQWRAKVTAGDSAGHMSPDVDAGLPLRRRRDNGFAF